MFHICKNCQKYAYDELNPFHKAKIHCKTWTSYITIIIESETYFKHLPRISQKMQIISNSDMPWFSMRKRRTAEGEKHLVFHFIVSLQWIIHRWKQFQLEKACILWYSGTASENTMSLVRCPIKSFDRIIAFSGLVIKKQIR